MGELVNLRRARKKSLREADARKADENRVAFGVPKSARDKARRENEATIARLEGHRGMAARALAEGSETEVDGPERPA